MKLTVSTDDGTALLVTTDLATYLGETSPDEIADDVYKLARQLDHDFAPVELPPGRTLYFSVGRGMLGLSIDNGPARPVADSKALAEIMRKNDLILFSSALDHPEDWGKWTKADSPHQIIENAKRRVGWS